MAQAGSCIAPLQGCTEEGASLSCHSHAAIRAGQWQGPPGLDITCLRAAHSVTWRAVG